jgi:hypothetical protein
MVTFVCGLVDDGVESAARAAGAIHNPRTAIRDAFFNHIKSPPRLNYISDSPPCMLTISSLSAEFADCLSPEDETAKVPATLPPTTLRTVAS